MTLPMGEKYKADEVIGAIRGTFGIKTAAAEALGCTRQTIDNYIKRHPTIARAYQEERERLLDMAESKFAQAIKGGEWAAISFALRTLGRNRGFVERQEIEQVGDLRIELGWDDADNGDNAAEAALGRPEADTG